MANTPLSKIEFDHFIWTDMSNPTAASLNTIAEEHDLDIFQIKDSLQVGHLPKYEKLDKYHFIILRGYSETANHQATTINELSNKIAFFYNDKKLITVHRSPFLFLNKCKSNYKSSEALLLDIISKMLETYDLPLSKYDEKIAQIEKIIFLGTYNRISVKDLYFLKTQTRITKKILVLFQTVINQLEVKQLNNTALQDLKDRVLNLIVKYDEVLESSQNLLNTFLSVNSQKSNDVMKLLTIFSAFFLPLTFIAGIYGMNFEHMPELKSHNGYFVTLISMGVIALVIYIWFRIKRII